jgi:acetyl/propionyl-CoA carboxylase alpha subunit
VARSAGLAIVVSAGPIVRPVGPGVFRVEHDGRSDIVYAAGRGAERWLFWNGHVFHTGPATPSTSRTSGTARTPGTSGTLSTLTAPMPARVVKVLVHPDDNVRRGDTLVLLEAMKMELPVRALDDARIVAVHCRDGELVQAEAPLVDLT